jgi:hypothetical protein
MLISCVICTSTVIFRWIAIRGVAGLIVVANLVWLLSGAILSLPPSKSNSKSVIGTRSRASFAVASLGLLVGSSVASAILQDTVHLLGCIFSLELRCWRLPQCDYRFCKMGLVVSKAV